MKKSSNKPKSTINGFTATEVGTIIEQFRSEFKVFGERQEGIREKLDATYEQVVRNTEDISMLKAAVKEMVAKITELTEDVVGLKTAVKDMSSGIEKLTKSINRLTETKADREEFQILEKRISILEAKVTSLTG